MNSVTVIGAGLAGAEAGYQLSRHGIKVRLYDMKPYKKSPAHKYDGFAELVCSNSLKAKRLESAAGMLKEEMRLLGSITMEAADKTAVSAGGALAVDRKAFSDYITDYLSNDKNIEIICQEVTKIPLDENVIIATGPLTGDALSEDIKRLCGEDYLYFHDAAAPIVSAESLDMDRLFKASRYDRGDADYLNCPMDKQEYLEFYSELVNAESAPLKEFDKEHFEKDSFKVYEGCMPIEVLAKRGEDTMRFGPLKPVGLIDSKTGKRPYAAVQLRSENSQSTMYNLVGFQTNLKFGEQKRVFSMIPGLKNAEFLRYGVMHRNTFINSPRLLDCHYSMRKRPNIFFAGQITGVEGYIESAASGIIAGINMSRRLKNEEMLKLPKTTMTGALSAYISDESVVDFQPMGCNMGILPALENKIKNKQERYLVLAQRGISALKEVLDV